MFSTLRLAREAREAMKLLGSEEFYGETTLRGKVEVALDRLSDARAEAFNQLKRAAHAESMLWDERHINACLHAELAAANAKIARMQGGLKQNRRPKAA